VPQCLGWWFCFSDHARCRRSRRFRGPRKARFGFLGWDSGDLFVFLVSFVVQGLRPEQAHENRFFDLVVSPMVFPITAITRSPDHLIFLQPSADVPSASYPPPIDVLLKTKAKPQFERPVESLSTPLFRVFSSSNQVVILSCLYLSCLYLSCLYLSCLYLFCLYLFCELLCVLTIREY
jgi:hypothetical protein